MEIEKLAEHYVSTQHIDYGDWGWKAEEQIGDAFIRGYETAEKELYTKEDIYNCLGAFAYKYGITINGNDLTKWLKDGKL